MSDYSKIASILETAWQNKNFNLLRSILADDLEWYEGSFGKPLTTANDVIAQWENDLSNQNNLKVEVQLLDGIDQKGYYHSKASWIDNLNKKHDIDGIFKVNFNKGGKIVYFNQWWTQSS